MFVCGMLWFYNTVANVSNRIATILKLHVCALQIALTTLEEVFLNIAKQAEIENAQGKDVIVQAEVDGKLLPVQVGQELVTDPATNKSYRLAWGQNHNGELCVSEVFPLPA